MNENDAKHFIIISNICFEPYLSQYIKDVFGREVDVSAVPFAEVRENKYNETLHVADYIIVSINLAERFPDLLDKLRVDPLFFNEAINVMVLECSMLIDYLSNTTTAPIFWLSFEGHSIFDSNFFGDIPVGNNIVGQLNQKLYNLKIEQIIYLDMERIIANIGGTVAFNVRGKYRWNAPYSKALISELVNSINFQIRMLNGCRKKCIVLDCDNVLWGGIISEDNIAGIKIAESGCGREYQEFQRYLKLLYDYGIILAICSKNDLSDVYHVFQNHNAMILTQDHISCFCVNWNNKAENLKWISSQLNISLDSIIFVDDSYFEVESVRMLLPEVTSILYNRETIVTELAMYIGINEKNSYENSVERQQTYLTNQKRNKLRETCFSFEEYLNLLEMHIDIQNTKDSDYNRICELTQRANQFTNGARYSLNDLKKFAASGGEIYSVFLKDKYSDLGLVGAIGINSYCVTLLVLSCRALGRNVENTMFDFIMERGCVESFYLETGKNHTVFEKLIERAIKIVNLEERKKRLNHL